MNKIIRSIRNNVQFSHVSRQLSCWLKGKLFLIWGIILSLFFLCASCSTPAPLNLAQMQSPPFSHPRWDTRPLSPQETEMLFQALQQKYSYFGRGGQCYAFFSDDGQYVLKFFRQSAYNPSAWHRLTPFLPSTQKKIAKRQAKRERAFSSYKIAFEELQTLTDVIYLHLNSSDHLPSQLTLIDPQGTSQVINLNSFQFILQRRADLILPTLTRMIEQGQLDLAKRLIDQLDQLIDQRCAQGYEDWDAGIATNCGLVDGHVIKIDVGRFEHNPEMQTDAMRQAECTRILTPLQQWLANLEPRLALYCEEKIRS